MRRVYQLVVGLMCVQLLVLSALTLGVLAIASKASTLERLIKESDVRQTMRMESEVGHARKAAVDAWAQSYIAAELSRRICERQGISQRIEPPKRPGG